jgi:hypothetical protein
MILFSSTLPQRLDYRIREGPRPGSSAYVARQRLLCRIDLLERSLHPIGRIGFVDVPQHQNGRLQ